MNRKLISICALIAMAALVIAGAASMAYFSDTVETDGNLLTSGNVDVEFKDNSTGDISLVASSSFTKNLEIKNAGSSDAYVRVKIEVPEGISVAIDETIDTTWNLEPDSVNTNTYYVYYTSVLTKNTGANVANLTVKLTTGTEAKGTESGTIVLVSGGEEYTAEALNDAIKFTAEAIQSSGFEAEGETPAYVIAFKAFDGENLPSETTNE